MSEAREETAAEEIRVERVDEALAEIHHRLITARELGVPAKKNISPFRSEEAISPLESAIITERVADLRPRVILKGEEVERNGIKSYYWHEDPYFISSTDPSSKPPAKRYLLLSVDGHGEAPDIQFSYFPGRRTDITINFNANMDSEIEQEPHVYNSGIRPVSEMNPLEYEVVSYVLDKAIAQIDKSPKKTFDDKK